MRKYQQLFLIIISLISVSILLVYKSENNRLKYILQVVNFFGRNDAAVLSRLENGTKQEALIDFASPLPVWQRVSEHFYLYTAFWEELDASQGGGAVAIAVGPADAIINFKCGFRYSNGSEVRGNFLFTPVNMFYSEDNKGEPFSILKFICQVKKDLPQHEAPTTLILIEAKSGREHEVMLRSVKSLHPKLIKTSVVACLNLVPYTSKGVDAQFLSKKNLMQFFMHHQIAGIEEFIVYNGDLVSPEIKRILFKASIRVHYLPFNFPFSSRNSKVRGVVEMDCLMRTVGASKYALLLDPNEFFYPNSNIQFKDSVVAGLVHYAQHFNRFELPLFSVCMDHKNKLLVDNNFYDPEHKVGHTIYISKSTLHPENVPSSISLPVSKAFVHVYINCVSSKDLLYDWRNSVREDFMQYIQTMRNEVSFLF